MGKNKLPIKLMLYRRHLISAAYNDGFSVKEVADLFKLTRQYIYEVLKTK